MLRVSLLNNKNDWEDSLSTVQTQQFFNGHS